MLIIWIKYLRTIHGAESLPGNQRDRIGYKTDGTITKTYIHPTSMLAPGRNFSISTVNAGKLIYWIINAPPGHFIDTAVGCVDCHEPAALVIIVDHVATKISCSIIIMHKHFGKCQGVRCAISESIKL